MVMPSAPPSVASAAAATGSGSRARRACRTVATWSMFTPRRIIGKVPSPRFQVNRHKTPRSAAYSGSQVFQLGTWNLELSGVAGEVIEYGPVAIQFADEDAVGQHRQYHVDQAFEHRADDRDAQPHAEQEVVEHE